MKEARKKTRAEVKRGKKHVGTEEEIEEYQEDLLATDCESESLSEGEKEETVKMMKQLYKESEEGEPTSEEEEDESQDVGDKLEGDFVPQNVEPVSEPIPENPPSEANQTVEPPVKTNVGAATIGTDSTAEAGNVVFYPTRKMRTKNVTKKRKMAMVDEVEELKEGENNVDDDEMLDPTINTVMHGLADATATGAAVVEAAKKEDANVADFEGRS